MKKIVTIIFLSVYLLATTELSQLFKLPILIEHFIEHKSQNEQLSFYAFLKMHYDHPVKDADYETDQKLPFVVHSEVLTLICLVGQPVDFKSHPLKHFPLKFVLLNQCLKDKRLPSDIWQPPRFC